MDNVTVTLSRDNQDLLDGFFRGPKTRDLFYAYCRQEGFEMDEAEAMHETISEAIYEATDED